jgi:hypothetical protein
MSAFGGKADMMIALQNAPAAQLFRRAGGGALFRFTLPLFKGCARTLMRSIDVRLCP